MSEKTKIPKIALFADTFTEVNGAANVLRRLAEYAKENNFPFLCIYGGDEAHFEKDGSLWRYQIKRHKAISFKLDSELRYDPFLWRYKGKIKKKLNEFEPDVLQVTGVNDLSQIGLYFAHFKNLPAIASWHTNAHEYAVKRLVKLTRYFPKSARKKFESVGEKVALFGVMKMLFAAQIQLAPNEELVELLKEKTNRPSYLMRRGVDTEDLTPAKRNRTDDILTLGYVGRLRAEKNVRFLVEVEKNLIEKGITDYKFLIVGDGDEEDWLKENLKNAYFTGVLKGEKLFESYANMDLFLFPSKTDAFGNVVLEAMAAGVPSVVLPDNGPKFLIEQGVNGHIAEDEKDFIEYVENFVKNHDSLPEMRKAARRIAKEYSWQSIFEGIYDIYRMAVVIDKKVRASDMEK